MQTNEATPQQINTQHKSRTNAVGVMLTIPVDKLYDYALPDKYEVVPGSIVRVPLGKRSVVGVIWGQAQSKIVYSDLRQIETVIDLQPLKEDIRKFIDWVGNYTLAKRGLILRMVINSSVVDYLPKKQVVYTYTNKQPKLMTEARRRSIEAASIGLPKTAKELSKIANVTPNVIKKLAQLGCLKATTSIEKSNFPTPKLWNSDRLLSNKQKKAASLLKNSIKKEAFSVTVLDGVTGSGKTEVYFEAINYVLQKGKQVLIMLPEISLSAQWLMRFEYYFKASPAIWHSEVSNKRRAKTWRAVSENSAPIVVGARSALWLPFRNLGLIVVDEEHDSAYKQEEGVIYHARDMAVARAKINALPVVLVSATPSLETVQNIEIKKYKKIQLKTRFGGARLPKIKAIDMREVNIESNRWLSKPIQSAIKNTIDSGEQTALFLNRRGYAPLTLCRACGYRLQCSNCSTWLVEHRKKRVLNCHHCGFSIPLQEKCPECEVEGKLAACGPGVERLAEEVESLFPNARIQIATSDTMSSPSAAENVIKRIIDHQVDIVVGTQVIAKGHHFPMMTLIGVVDADLGLSGGDLRAAEQTYQLLHQVSGRAGRAKHDGNVILQTFMPEHPVMKALISGQRDQFLKEESIARLENDLPPYGHLVSLIFSGTDNNEVSAFASKLASLARKQVGINKEITIYGPAPAPFTFLRNKYRHRILIKAKDRLQVQSYLRQLLANCQPKSRVRVQVDVDPHSFL